MRRTIARDAVVCSIVASRAATIQSVAVALTFITVSLIAARAHAGTVETAEMRLAFDAERARIYGTGKDATLGMPVTTGKGWESFVSINLMDCYSKGGAITWRGSDYRSHSTKSAWKASENKKADYKTMSADDVMGDALCRDAIGYDVTDGSQVGEYFNFATACTIAVNNTWFKEADAAAARGVQIPLLPTFDVREFCLAGATQRARKAAADDYLYLREKNAFPPRWGVHPIKKD
jgi:hypothetical protein